VTLAIGPEGGWTDEEFSVARKSGFEEASLGSLILRTETAVCCVSGIGELRRSKAMPIDNCRTSAAHSFWKEQRLACYKVVASTNVELGRALTDPLNEATRC